MDKNSVVSFDNGIDEFNIVLPEWETPRNVFYAALSDRPWVNIMKLGKVITDGDAAYYDQNRDNRSGGFSIAISTSLDVFTIVVGNTEDPIYRVNYTLSELKESDIATIMNVYLSRTDIDRIMTFRGGFYYLSNFFETYIAYKGLVFTNSEAAFQSQKTYNSQDWEKFTSMSASEAKRAGRRSYLREDWEDVKDSIMREVIKAKFDCNPILKEALLNTGNKYLEEGTTWHDHYWGTCEGVGRNRLGTMLMQLRDEYKAECGGE